LSPSDYYQAYTENRMLGSNPVELVIALYERAIEATQEATNCLETGDIWGRSKAVSRATNIVTELIISLDERKGASLTHNLNRLYSYMQARLLEGHVKKTSEPFQEVARLLTTLLEAWRVVAVKTAQASLAPENGSQSALVPESEMPVPYGGYLYETTDHFARTGVTF
jgi:flagellar secretion chaperone FliS